MTEIKKKKLHVLLALREKGDVIYKSAISDLIQKFKNKQGLFRGVKKTFTAKEGWTDDPTKRSNVRVESTVKEQFNYFLDVNKDYVKNLFDIEATNSSGTAKATLVVAGEIWGEYSSLELLRLKSLLEDGKFKEMMSNIPVRTETKNWDKSNEDIYQDRAVVQTERDDYTVKTTVKETYIVTDPHIKEGVKSERPPITAERSTVVETGSGTTQEFSGEYSIRQRAYMIKRHTDLYRAVVEALEVANGTEVVESDLGVQALEFLYNGTE